MFVSTYLNNVFWTSPDGSRVKKLLVNVGDMGSILDLGRSTKPDQLSQEQLSQGITSTESVCCNY